MAKLTLSTIGSRYGSVEALNANFDAIEQAFQDVVYRDGSAPNYMEADIDMNGFGILNLSDLVVGGVNISGLNSAVVWRGAWDAARTYAVSDAIYYNGSSYICTTAHVNSVPPSASWDVYAAGGVIDATTLVSKTSETGTAALPSGTTAQRSTTLGVGVRYNTDTGSFEGYDGAAWGAIGGGATGGGDDTVFQNNKTVMTASYTLPAGSNASTVGPLTINAGVTLTVPSGQRLVIL